MIKDKEALKNIRSEWTTARDTWDLIAGNIRFSFTGGGFTSYRFRCISYSLTLLFAFTAIEHALQQLRNEGHFHCKAPFFGPLMEASKNSIKWTNYDLVEEGYLARNKIAHHQEWPEIEDCKQYLDSIGTELHGWNIIS